MRWNDWVKLLAFCFVFNLAFITVPIALFFAAREPAAGLFAIGMGIYVGAPIAIWPTVWTVILAVVVSRCVGYFTFGQFFLAGTAVSAGLLWHELASGNDIWVGYGLVLAPILPVGWIVGWLVARLAGVLPNPMPPLPVLPRRPAGGMPATLVSVLLVAVATATVTGLFGTIGNNFKDRAEARRGKCPADLICTTGPGEPRQPDPRLYLAMIAGMRMIIPANNIYMGLSNDEHTPGEVSDLYLKGLLPDFAPRSIGNNKEFEGLAPDTATALARPSCPANGGCRTLDWYVEHELGGGKSWESRLIPNSSGDAPTGLDHVGDFASFGGSEALYRSTSGGNWIICNPEGSVPVPHCTHYFSWRSLNIKMRYQAKWLDRWTQARAGLIDRLEEFARTGPLPESIIHVVDPLPKSDGEPA